MTGETTHPAERRLTDDEINRLVRDLTDAARRLTRTDLDGVTLTPETANRIIGAALRHATYVDFYARIDDAIVLEPTEKSVRLIGDVAGSLGGFGVKDLMVLGEVGGSIDIHRSGRVGVAGHVMGEVTVNECDTVECHGRVDGDFTVFGGAKDVYVGAVMYGFTEMDPERRSGFVAGDLRIVDRVEGTVEVAGTVSGVVHLHDGATGQVVVRGEEVGAFWANGELEGLSIAGTKVRHGIYLEEVRVKGVTTLAPGMIDPGVEAERPAQLVTVRRASFGDEVLIADNVDISTCDFTRCSGLRRFNLAGAHLFFERATLSSGPFPTEKVEPPVAERMRDPSTVQPTLAKDDKGRVASPSEMASIYRQLRGGMEAGSNRAAAGVFYEGEMDARLAASGRRGRRAEWLTLAGYRWMSRYGLSIARPLFWFAMVAVVGGCLLAVGGLDLDSAPGSAQLVTESAWDWDGMPAAITFAVRSMLSFFSPPSAQFGVGGQWLQMGLRFVGPALLAQALLALRERVRR